MLEPRMRAQRFLSCRLCDYRAYWRLSQRELAEYLSVSIRTLQRWEAAETLPDWPMWARVVMDTDQNTDPRSPDYLEGLR